MGKKKYIGSLWTATELKKQQTQSPSICHFCTSKNECIFEKDLKKDQWCGAFEANPAHFYTFKGWTWHPHKNRPEALKAYRNLLEIYPHVLAICVEREKPMRTYRQKCKACGKNGLIFKGNVQYSRSMCDNCFAFGPFDPECVVHETVSSPICENLLKVKKRLVYGINKLTHEIAEKAKRDRRKEKEQK